MSEKEGSRKDPLTPSDWVSELASDPCEIPPDVKQVDGFPGKSGKDGFVRLYRSRRLDSYFEFSRDAVRHAEESDDGRTRVWVEGSADVRSVRIESEVVQARYLEGKFTSRFFDPLVGMSGAAVRENAKKDWTDQWFCTDFCTDNWYLDCTNHVGETDEIHLTEEDNECRVPCILTFCPIKTNTHLCPRD